MKVTSLLIVLVCLFIFSSCTKNTASDSKEAAAEENELEDGSKFAVSAADAGLMEVQLATLALSKATSGKVKEFAQMMLDDHTKANEELKALAQKKNITLPTSLSDKHQKKYTEMSEKNGADFDKEYCDLMVKDHRDVVEMFKKAQENSKDPELKAWASEKLPTLEHHLSMAERMKESV
jgi:putative membrane protein